MPSAELPKHHAKLRHAERAYYDMRSYGTRSGPTTVLKHVLSPSLSEQAQPVAVHDLFHVGRRVATVFQQRDKGSEIGDSIQVGGSLFGAVATVQVAADPHMLGTSGQLTDVIEVIDRTGDL